MGDTRRPGRMRREGTSSTESGDSFRLEDRFLFHCSKGNGEKDEWVYMFIIAM